MAKPRIKAPKTASAGDVITIKTLITHKMESGQRKDKEGNLIPRKIINNFAVTLNDKPVFEMELAPAISVNPFISFSMKATESGTLKYVWTDDDGSTYDATSEITVS